MRILLVEDDESIREVFKLILESESPLPQLTVETACNGTEALERVNRTQPDLILLDLTLLNEHGFEVFKKIRHLEQSLCLKIQQTPIIAVTAHNQKELEKEAFDMGFSGYITKPFDFEKVLFPLMQKLLVSNSPHAA